MAENLNFAFPIYGNRWCYSDTASYCMTYGRLYDLGCGYERLSVRMASTQ
jgi:uncharacterized protein (TIGR02145 family)